MFDHLKIQQLLSPTNHKTSIAGEFRQANNTHTKKRIGDYAYYLNDLVGSGYSSQVYICHHRAQPNSQYAIKVIKLSKISKSHLHLLQNQIQILRSLDHPNIIKFHDVYYTQNNCYLITDYCDGGTLQAYVQKKKLIDLEDVFQQLIEGCKYLAEMLIIHRDIKPANVFKKGKQWKIGDFGFARFISSKETVIKQVYKVGSPLYMPLQTIKNSIYSLKTDSYALGVLLFHIVTQKFPYSGNNSKQLIHSYETMQFSAQLINHLPNKRINSIRALCNNNMNERPYISDLQPITTLSNNSQIFQQQFITNNIEIKKYSSIQTNNDSPQKASSMCQIESYEPQTLITDIFTDGIDLDIIQRLKLCKVIHYLTMNVQNYEGILGQIRQDLRRLLNMLIILYGWRDQQSYSKYVHQFWTQGDIKQTTTYSQTQQLRHKLNHVIDDLVYQQQQNRTLQIIRLKMVQLSYIIKLLFSKKTNKLKEYIGKLVVHPDFAKVFMFPNQIQEIQALVQKL